MTPPFPRWFSKVVPVAVVAFALWGLVALAQWGILSSPPALAEGESGKRLEALAEGGPAARRGALLELAEKGTVAAVPAIVKVLREGDPELSQLAENALWSIWTRSGDPEVDHLLRMGTGFLSNGALTQAAVAFDRVIQMRPDFAEGYNKRATVLYYQGKYLLSLKDIDETLKRNPYHFGALNGAGLCMIGLRRFREALGFFDRALKINPTMPGIIELRKQTRSYLKKPVA